MAASPAAGVSERGDLLHSTMRQCTKGVLFAALIGVFVNALHMCLPLYTIQIYDRVLSSRSIDTLTMLTGLAVVILAFLAVLDYLRSRVFMVVGEQVARRLSAATLEAAVRTSLHKPSPLATQATRDLQDLRQFLTSGPVCLPIDALFTPLFMMILLLVHPAYLAVCGVAVVVMVGFGLITEFVARRPAGRANEMMLKSQGEVSTAIRHAEVIESMGMLPSISRRWLHGQGQAMAVLGSGARKAKGLAAASRSIRMVLQISMLATGVVLVIDQATSPGAMIAATIMMGRIMHPFEQLIDGWRQWSQASSAYSRLRGLLASVAGERSRTPIAAEHGRLTVEAVTFVPPGLDRAVLKGVRFALEPGEVLGIVGPSGAGKSTLARLLVGVWRPTSGGIYLDGHDVFTWERESFGRHVGYLPQNAVLLDGTIRENISRFTDADPADVIAAARLADVHDLIGHLPLGYETRVGDNGFALSGGQRQRIALARALFGQPKLVILDEPNANVDNAGEQALMQSIRDIRSSGSTVVIIAHRTSVMSVADKLLVLRDGVVDQFGPRAAILKALTQPVRSVDPKVAALPFERAVGNG